MFVLHQYVNNINDAEHASKEKLFTINNKRNIYKQVINTFRIGNESVRLAIVQILTIQLLQRSEKCGL